VWGFSRLTLLAKSLIAYNRKCSRLRCGKIFLEEEWPRSAFRFEPLSQHSFALTTERTSN